MSTILHWNGDQIARRSFDAARKGIDRTTAECAEYAKENHPWENVTGTAEGSIQMRPARYDPATHKISGQFGSYGVIYFLWLELGTIKMAAMPSLRPALDACAQNLERNIQDAWQEGSGI